MVQKPPLDPETPVSRATETLHQIAKAAEKEVLDPVCRKVILDGTQTALRSLASKSAQRQVTLYANDHGLDPMNAIRVKLPSASQLGVDAGARDRALKSLVDARWISGAITDAGQKDKELVYKFMFGDPVEVEVGSAVKARQAGRTVKGGF